MEEMEDVELLRLYSLLLVSTILVVVVDVIVFAEVFVVVG